MKILIISGTPKKDGICRSLVTAAATAAADVGAETEIVDLAKYKLTSCRMCGDGWGICYSEHFCEFGEKDGFNELQNKIHRADALVYITPVYWGEVSEAFKIFLDKLRRCQATKRWDKKDDCCNKP